VGDVRLLIAAGPAWLVSGANGENQTQGGQQSQYAAMPRSRKAAPGWRLAWGTSSG
jgi:hypothetical protein